MKLHNRLLDSLSEESRTRLKKYLVLQEIRKGALIGCGSSGQSLYFPINCVVAIKTQRPPVTKTHLQFIGPESAFGFEAVLMPATVCFEARTVGAGYLYEVSRERFVGALDLQQSIHVFRAQFAALIAERALVNGGCCALHSTAARLARLILEAGDAFGADAPLTLTQREVAEMLSVRRESVATIFGEWSSRGIIETSRGRLSVPSRDAMLSLSCACYEATKQIAGMAYQQWCNSPWSRHSSSSAQEAA